MEFLRLADLESTLSILKRRGRKVRSQAVKKEDLREFQNRLLVQTLSYARKFTTYYPTFLKQTLGKLTIDDLENIPTIDKRKVVFSLRRMISIERKPCTFHRTGGTTGKPLDVPVFYDELRARSLFNTIGTVLSHHDKLGWGVLSLEELYHGVGLAPLSDSRAYNLVYEVFQGQALSGLHNPLFREQVRRIDDIMTGKSPILDLVGRPKMLCIGPKNLFLLTKELRKLKRDPREYGLKVICTSGNYVSSRIRRIAGEVWNAELQDNYGLTEICAGASECSKGNYHFDQMVVPEILHLNRFDRGRSDSTGEIALTGLHPFQQALPLIRYRTGDYGRFLDQCECGVPGRAMSSYLGRTKDCIVTGPPEGKAILSPIPLSEALDETGMCSSFESYDRVYPRFSWKIREKRRGRFSITVVVKTKRETDGKRSDLRHAVVETVSQLLHSNKLDDRRYEIHAVLTPKDAARWIDL